MPEDLPRSGAGRPNLVFLLTDQQRVDTIRAWGFPHMTTPAMDRLAGAGMSFTRAFAPAATCVPSRAAIFTGMWPHNSGVFTFQRWAHLRNWVQDLAEAGYHCASIGKMHLKPEFEAGGFHDRVVVENPTSAPAVFGGPEDDWGRHLAAHGAKRPVHRHRTDPLWDERLQCVPWEDDEHLHSDVFIGDRAVDWIDGYDGREPFFLQVGLVGPHEPWDPLPRHLEAYRGLDVPMPRREAGELSGKPPQHEAWRRFLREHDSESRIRVDDASEAQLAAMRRHYYAKVTTVDEQVGKVLDALGRRGFLDNAVVVLASDHGELLGDHGLAYKWLLYDPVVHVPLVVWDTRRPPAAARHEGLATLLDIGPTFLDAAGLAKPYRLEGRSLLGRYGDTSQPGEEAVFCEDNYLVMVRTRTHKLVRYLGQEQGELYDLVEDPHEFRNRWDDPGLASAKAGLLARLHDWYLTSVYFNGAHKTQASCRDVLRWPTRGPALHG